MLILRIFFLFLIAMSHFFDATEADFDELVVAASHAFPILVDIGADWCAPCKVLTPALHRVIEEAAGQVRLALVDADENMRIAGRHKVRGFPTVVAYSGGVEVARFHGAQTQGFLRQFIAGVLASHRQGEAPIASAP